mmetsp:Transcript_28060/g.39441  ORF Transcript_28060/g.39441 Transcript_28060/m.39441 type:complete len:98 (-) Transcript_28060:532-825(-)
MAGIQRDQFATNASGTSSLSRGNISSADRPSNTIKLNMNVGKNMGAKKAWSRNVRFNTTDIELPGIFLIRAPYQKWTTGATKKQPKIPNRPVRYQSG